MWWQGKGGMLTNQLRNHIRTMLNFEHPPDYLIIHVGANDLGSMSTMDLCNKLKNTVKVISAYNVLGTRNI
jgi:lysophospholipase L1-like esterase